MRNARLDREIADFLASSKPKRATLHVDADRARIVVTCPRNTGEQNAAWKVLLDAKFHIWDTSNGSITIVARDSHYRKGFTVEPCSWQTETRRIPRGCPCDDGDGEGCPVHGIGAP